jgi:HK97 family phage major capsid protein
MPTQLQDARAKLHAKSTNFKKIFDQSKTGNGDYDFLKADAFAHLSDAAQARSMIQQLEKELDELSDQVKSLEWIEETEKKAQERWTQMQQAAEPHIHANGHGNGQGQGVIPQALMTMGQLLKKYWPQDNLPRGGNAVYVDRTFEDWDYRSVFSGSGGYELKTIMTTGAGWAPEAIRIPRIAEMPYRPLEVIDLFPVANTTQFQISWMEETTRTNPAVETAENAAFLEATLATTARSTAVRKIPVYLRVTDEQMADVDQVAGYVDSRLRSFVQERLDLQLMVGDGTGINLLGMINVSGVLVQAKGADTTVDAIYKAMDQVRVTGRATPGAVVIHPTNFQPVRLLKDTTGQYIWGPPTEGATMRMWGVPVVLTSALTVGTAQVGDYVGHSQLWMRQGVEVLAGFVNDDFINGRQAIRASLRAALAAYRPQAFCNVTGL